MDAENYTNEECETGMRMNLRQRPPRKVNELNFNEDSNDYDAEKTRKKIKKKPTTGRQITAYDEYGHIRYNGKDICDCMDENCPGCWYPCKCGSTKCGIDCRVNRKFFYENVTFDGKDMTIYNKQFPTSK